MKKLILAVFAILFSMSAFAVTAYFTGQQEFVTTVTGQVAWRCHYQYAGQEVVAVFKGSCPRTIEVY